MASYGSAADGSPDRITFEVSDGGRAPFAVVRSRVGSRLVPLGGGTTVEAVWHPDGKLPMLTWQAGDGTTHSLSGGLDLARALAIARSVEPVDPDDPRLVAAEETPAPTNT
jgi:hypothetical protein